MMNKQLPEGYHSDENAIWCGAENKEDATVRLDFNKGKVYYEGNTDCSECKKKLNDNE